MTHAECIAWLEARGTQLEDDGCWRLNEGTSVWHVRGACTPWRASNYVEYIGRGDTPQEALADLLPLMQEDAQRRAWRADHFRALIGDAP